MPTPTAIPDRRPPRRTAPGPRIVISSASGGYTDALVALGLATAAVADKDGVDMRWAVQYPPECATRARNAPDA